MQPSASDSGTTCSRSVRCCASWENRHLTGAGLPHRLDSYVPPEYYRRACDCILEMAIKLTHVVWRKLLPNDREAADSALNATCLELLIHENYSLAKNILGFACNVIKKHSSEKFRLMFLVNLAQSLKWSGTEDECQRLLKQEDWTAKGLEFRLCVSVLLENYEEAVAIMRQIGRSGDLLNAEAYREWPVFRKARKERVFQDAYRDVFDEEMKLGESLVLSKMTDLQEFFKNTIAKRVGKEVMASSASGENTVDEERPNVADVDPKGDSRGV